jgi:hypothetical protein
MSKGSGNLCTDVRPNSYHVIKYDVNSYVTHVEQLNMWTIHFEKLLNESPQ